MDNFSMENKSDENKKSCETVTLVLKTKRFEVEKRKLIDKSQYFAALLSANYIEYRQTEHIINYDISAILLQDFIDWIHNDELNTSATSFNFEDFDRLMFLLELSVLFAADNLLKDVANRLETHYMLPKYSLNIWLLAQELSINSLRDLSLAVCLDAFIELPPRSICKLSRENFLKLIGNVNIRSKKSYLLRITHKWMNYNPDFTVSLDIIAKHKKAILESIISCSHDNIKDRDNIKSGIYIHFWDGKDLYEHTSFNYPKDITDCSTGKNTLEGMQIVGRTYDLYLCGGEFRVGSGKFNKNVWRYSLISKKWYIQTVMPVERKHMVATFLNNKLLLVGGIGKDQKLLQSVDIYDIYTDTWTAGPILPWKFTVDPIHFIYNEKLIIMETSGNFIYCLLFDKDVWKKKRMHIISYNFDNIFVNMTLSTLTTITYSIFDVFDSNENETCGKLNCISVNRRLVRIMELDNLNSSNNICIKYTDKGIAILKMSEKSCKTENRTKFMCMDCYDTLHLYIIHIPNSYIFPTFNPFYIESNVYKKIFYLNHPADLHTTNLDDIKFI